LSYSSDTTRVGTILVAGLLALTISARRDIATRIESCLGGHSPQPMESSMAPRGSKAPRRLVVLLCGTDRKLAGALEAGPGIQILYLPHYTTLPAQTGGDHVLYCVDLTFHLNHSRAPLIGSMEEARPADRCSALQHQWHSLLWWKQTRPEHYEGRHTC
jgi:hypothetical protein